MYIKNMHVAERKTNAKVTRKKGGVICVYADLPTHSLTSHPLPPPCHFTHGGGGRSLRINTKIPLFPSPISLHTQNYNPRTLRGLVFLKFLFHSKRLFYSSTPPITDSSITPLTASTSSTTSSTTLIYRPTSDPTQSHPHHHISLHTPALAEQTVVH